MPQGGSISDETADYIVQLDDGTDFALPRLKVKRHWGETGCLQRKKWVTSGLLDKITFKFLINEKVVTDTKLLMEA